MPQYRQGDVLVEAIAAIPATAKKITAIDGRPANVLALGETSGHGHVLVADNYDVYEVPDGFIVDVRSTDAAVKHLMVASGVWTKEHHEVPLVPGVYKVTMQFQYNPYARAIERVAD